MFDILEFVAGVDEAYADFFFLFPLATDNGLNMKGLPLVTGAVVEGSDDSPVLGTRGKVLSCTSFVIVSASASLSASEFRNSASDSRLKPGSAPVLRLNTLRVEGFEGILASASRLGGGRKELKPLKVPAPTLGLFGAGSSSVWPLVSLMSCNRTWSFRGFALLTEKVGLEVVGGGFVVVDVAVLCGCDSSSEPSESE